MKGYIKQLCQNIQPVEPLDLFYVYALWHDNEIVYIGQSTQVISRIMSHRKSKTFDSYSYISCADKLDMDLVEEQLIAYLKPKYNRLIPAAYTPLRQFRERIRRISDYHRYSPKYYVSRISEKLQKNGFELIIIDGTAAIANTDIPAAMRCIVGEDYGK